MSVVRKKPFIEKFLAKLTAEQLTSLLSTINSDTTPIRYSLVDRNLFIPAYTQDSIAAVTLELEQGKPAYNGFLIYVTDKDSEVICLFIGYHRFQDLMLVEIDPTHRTFNKINEYCDINELRRVLYDKMDESGATTDLTPAKLESVLRARTGSGIVVDRSEDEEHTEIALDQDILDDINGGCTVTINDNNISLQQFIDNCESGIYTTVGTVATMHNLINGEDFDIRLIGINHDVLSVTDAGELEPDGDTVKTTWQFVNIPFQKVNLGLQFMSNDADVGWEGFNITYPSNLHGYSSAVGLLNAIQELYNALPLTLQNAMKTVRKDCYISVIYYDDYEPYNSTKTLIEFEQDRYGSCVNAKLFCLSATEVGIIPEDDDTRHFPYDCETSEGEQIMLEGFKYEYFDETKVNTQSSKRICNYQGEPYWYWLRSPYLDNSNNWGIVYDNGRVDGDSTDYDGGLAPAFCI